MYDMTSTEGWRPCRDDMPRTRLVRPGSWESLRAPVLDHPSVVQAHIGDG